MTSSLKRRKQGTTLTLAMVLVLVLELVQVLVLELVLVGHSGDFGNGAKFVWKMSKSVMQLISIRF